MRSGGVKKGGDFSGLRDWEFGINTFRDPGIPISDFGTSDLQFRTSGFPVFKFVISGSDPLMPEILSQLDPNDRVKSVIELSTRGFVSI